MLARITIGSETGQTAGDKLNAAIDAINHLNQIPVMTPVLIKTAYEQNADTNAFSDALKLKLEGIDLDTKVDKIAGKGLSELDFTTLDKKQVDTIFNKVDKITGKMLTDLNFGQTEKYLLDTALSKTDLNTPISPTNKIATMADVGTGSGGGGGVTTLGALFDVDVGGVRNDQVLTYNDTTSMWEAHDSQGGGTPIDAYTKAEADLKFTTKTELQNIKLTDISDFTGTPVAGQVMVFDGTNWSPANVTGGTY